jgi:UTP--glucose-1-phosphate uridylyltransferase
MCDVCTSTGGGVVGLKHVPRHEVSRYGVVAPTGEVDANGVVGVGDMVEKPSADDAPSDLIIIGRYVLTPDIFEEIARLKPGAGGELQLTDAMRVLAGSGPFHGVVGDIRRFDTGNPVGWLGAVVEFGLDHPQYGAAFRDELNRILS